MIPLIKTPKSDYSNFFDVARFKLTWQIGLFATIGLTVFVITLLLTIGPSVVYPTASAIILTVLALVIMYRTQKYKVAAFMFSIGGTIITNFSLFSFAQISHLIDVVWIVIILIYAYFALGKSIGFKILIADLLSICTYILFFLNTNVERIQPLKIEDKVALIISSIVCFSILSFILFLFVQTSKGAEDKYLKLTNELQTKNNEKDVLLKEIHHRVKNNLQVIISLIRLQSDKFTDEKKISLFRETEDRIRAMSHVHEKIYQTEDFANINLEDYLKTLITDMILSNSIDCQIDFSIQSNQNTLNIKSYQLLIKLRFKLIYKYIMISN